LLDYEYKHNYNLRKNSVIDLSPISKSYTWRNDDPLSEVGVPLGGT